MRDLSCVCNLHHSSRQCWILTPLSKARDWTWVLVDPSQLPYCRATTGTPQAVFCLFVCLFVFLFVFVLKTVPGKEISFKLCECWGRIRKMQSLHWSETMLSWLLELKVCPGAGEEIEPSSCKPGGLLTPWAGRSRAGTSSLFCIISLGCWQINTWKQSARNWLHFLHRPGRPCVFCEKLS